MVLVGKKIEEIQTIGEELFKLNLEAGLVANTQKTKLMNNSSNKKLVIEGHVTESVAEDEYLWQSFLVKKWEKKWTNELINHGRIFGL